VERGSRNTLDERAMEGAFHSPLTRRNDSGSMNVAPELLLQTGGFFNPHSSDHPF
jgi:hypothetical protein